MTPLKFTHAIWLPIAILLIAALLSFIVIWICYCIGDRQYRKDYEKKYNELKSLIEKPIDHIPVKLRPIRIRAIKLKFDEISTYSCKDYEKLQVLEKAFIQKFANKKKPKTLTDSDGIEYYQDVDGSVSYK